MLFGNNEKQGVLPAGCVCVCVCVCVCKDPLDITRATSKWNPKVWEGLK